MSTPLVAKVVGLLLAAALALPAQPATAPTATDQPRTSLVANSPAPVLTVRASTSLAHLPLNCQPEEVLALLTAFTNAFNTGNEEALASFFNDDLQWYSIGKFTTSDRTKLRTYFADRHEHGERIALLTLDMGHSWAPDRVAFGYTMRREAPDLEHGGASPGKGEISCRSQTIYVWSMAEEAP